MFERTLILAIFLISVVNTSSNRNLILEDYNYFSNFAISDTDLNFGVDTTAPVSWLLSSLLNDTYSSAFQALNKTISLSKEYTGALYNATFSLGNLKAEGFNILSMNKDAYKGFKNGTLGLGYYAKPSSYSIIDYFKKTGKIHDRVFTISYSGDSNKSIMIDIGNSPTNRDKFSFINITDPGFLSKYPNGWICTISHMLIGKDSHLNDTNYINKFAIIDSANNYINAPNSQKDLFYKYLDPVFNTSCKFEKVDDSEIIKCSDDISLSSIDPLIFVISGIGYSLNPRDLFDRYDDSNLEFLIKFSNDNYWHLGVPFLKHYITVFDADNKKIGFKGGNQIDYLNQWNLWQEENKFSMRGYNYLVVVAATALAGFLLIVIIFLIVRSYKRQRLSEHGPLIDEVK